MKIELNYPLQSDIIKALVHLEPEYYYYTCINGKQLFVRKNKKIFELLTSKNVVLQFHKPLEITKYKNYDLYYKDYNLNTIIERFHQMISDLNYIEYGKIKWDA